jgi:uncharacterized protein
MSSVDFVVTSRPTIRIAGRDDTGVTQGLVYMRIEDHTDGLAHCELQVGNWGLKGSETGFLYFDRRTLDFGKQLQVDVGRRTLFDGRITGLEAGFPESAPPVLTVLAEDRLQDLRLTRRTRTFVDMTDAAIFSQLATDHGLTPSIDADGPSHPVVTQVSESDLAFLRRRARLLGVELWATGSTLHIAPRGSRATGTPLTLGYARELREFTVLADLADQRSSVTVRGWDVSAKQEIAETADDGDLGSEAAGGDNGAAVLKAALAEHKEIVASDLPLTAAEASKVAKARLLEFARRFVSGRGVADIAPGIAVGTKVKIGGVGPLFEGEYYVTETTHVFDAAFGLRTEFSVERPWLGRPT